MPHKLRCIPEELLNQVDVGHDHAPAAVSAAAQLVHSITESPLEPGSRMRASTSSHIPIRHAFIEQVQVPLPQVAHDLEHRQIKVPFLSTEAHTFPHEKQRTGIIIANERDGQGGELTASLKPLKLFPRRAVSLHFLPCLPALFFSREKKVAMDLRLVWLVCWELRA